MFQRLRDKVQGWLLIKAMGYAFDHLEAQHVGKLLNEATDKKFGTAKSDPVQQRLAKWLTQVAGELSL